MYRLAEIGGGAQALLAMLNPKLDPVAFCDISEKKRGDILKIAETFKKEMKSVKDPTPISVYADYREMIVKEKPDIVFITTPNCYHAEMAVFALEHGCHVLVEKPMCTSLEDCGRMVEAVRKTGLKLAVNQCARTIQCFQFVFDQLAAGKIGTPYYVRAEYLHGSLTPRLEDPNDLSAQDPVLLGGGSHSIDLALGLIGGAPVSVFASGSKFMTSNTYKYNDRMNVLIDFDNGKTGYAVSAHSCYRRGLGITFELYGSKQDVIQTITYDQEKGTGLRVFDEDQAQNVTDFSKTQVEINLGHGQGFYRQQENLLYAIEHDVKQPTMADAVDGTKTTAVAIMAEKSVITGKAEKLPAWEPLTYKGNAPLWKLDDYQKDMFKEFVPLFSAENRSKILGRQIRH